MVAQFDKCKMVKNSTNTTITMILYPEKVLMFAYGNGHQKAHSLWVIITWSQQRVVTTDVDGVPSKMLRCGELRWPVDVRGMCVHSVHSDAVQFSCVQFSGSTQCFSQAEWHTGKCEICVTLKLFPKTAIALEQICISKTSIIAELTVYPNSHRELTIGPDTVYTKFSWLGRDTSHF